MQASSDSAARLATSAGQKLLLIGLGLAVLAVGVAAIEGLLALVGAGDRARWQDPFVGFEPGRPLFELRRDGEGRQVWATAPEKLGFFNPQQFAAVRPSGGLRIFCLGGSTTAGRPYDDRVSFCRWLELFLDAAEPGREHEVVNAGGISYASYRIVVLMRELVGYRPDLFVVYTGHNEFLEERSYPEIARQHPALRRLRLWLNGLRSYALARRAWLAAREGDGRPLLGAEVATRLDDWTGLERYQRDEALRRGVLEHFDDNLRRIVAIARDAGAGLLFVKPVSNLKDFSPFKSQHGAGLASAERRRVRMLLAEGAATAAPAAAVEILAAAVAADPDYAESRFRLGRALLAAGETEAARRELVEAKDRDVAPLRALEPLVATVEAVARETGTPWIDLPAVLEADSRERFGHAILGNEYLLDHVHPDIPVHARLAELILDRLTADGRARPAPAWGAELRRAIYERHLAGLDPAYYAERDLNLAKVLGWAGQYAEAEAPLRRALEVLEDRPEAWLSLGVVLVRTGRHEEALESLSTALALDPSAPEAAFNLGVALAELGRSEEAARRLRRAVELRPAYAEAWFDLGLVEAGRERWQAAASALERALELQPGSSRVLAELANAYGAAGRDEAAERAASQALAAGPDDPRALLAAARLAAGSNRAAEARELLERAAAIDPESVEVHFLRARLLAGEGRDGEAAAAYREALAIEPGHAESLNNLGILLGRQGRAAEAVGLLERAVERRPGYAEAWLNLGIVYDGAGRPADALAAVGRAVELAPDRPRFRHALGMLLLARGRTAEAREQLALAAAAGEPVDRGVLEQLGIAQPGSAP